MFFGTSTACGNADDLSHVDEGAFPTSTTSVNVYVDPFGGAAPPTTIETTTTTTEPPPPTTTETPPPPPPPPPSPPESESPDASEELGRWFIRNTTVGLDIRDGRLIMDRITFAIEIENIFALESGCSDIIAWAERMKKDYSPPLEQWVPTMQSYADFGSACLLQDVDAMSDALSRADSGITAILNTLEEATEWAKDLPF